MRRRGLHGAKVAYQRQQAEAAERAHHRHLVFLDLEFDTVRELMHAVRHSYEDEASTVTRKQAQTTVDGLALEARRIVDQQRAAICERGRRG